MEGLGPEPFTHACTGTTVKLKTPELQATRSRPSTPHSKVGSSLPPPQGQPRSALDSRGPFSNLFRSSHSSLSSKWIVLRICVTKILTTTNSASTLSLPPQAPTYTQRQGPLPSIQQHIVEFDFEKREQQRKRGARCVPSQKLSASRDLNHPSQHYEAVINPVIPIPSSSSFVIIPAVAGPTSEVEVGHKTKIRSGSGPSQRTCRWTFFLST